MSTDRKVEGMLGNPLIVVTGASQGIGAAIARRFASEGACSLALIARNRSRLEEVANECRNFSGVSAEVFVCDLTDPEAVDEMAAAVKKRFGAPAVLVNNAGGFVAGSFLEFSLKDFDAMWEINLRSAFLVSKAFVPAMVEAGKGDVFNIGSIAALGAHPGGTGYCAAKAGLLGLTRVMRHELKSHGIRVMSILSGPVETPSWDGSGMPSERLMPTEDIAETVVTLTRLSGRTLPEEIILRPMVEE